MASKSAAGYPSYKDIISILQSVDEKGKEKETNNEKGGENKLKPNTAFSHLQPYMNEVDLEKQIAALLDRSLDEQITNFDMKPINKESSGHLCQRCHGNIAEWACGNEKCELILFCPGCYSDYEKTSISTICPVCREKSQFYNYFSDAHKGEKEKQHIDYDEEKSSEYDEKNSEKIEVPLCNCLDIAEFCCNQDNCKALCFCKKCYNENQKTDLASICPVCKQDTYFYNYYDEEFGNNDELDEYESYEGGFEELDESEGVEELENL